MKLARNIPSAKASKEGRITRLLLLLLLIFTCHTALAEVVRVDIRRRDDAGTHERLIGRVHFAIDPALPANRFIADIEFAPKNKDGLVEFSSDLLLFTPKDAKQARGTVFLEVVNRGRDQSLAVMSAARQRDLSPESWDLGDRFLLEQGFTVGFLGWQFDVQPSQGLTFQAPIADVEGIVRESYIHATSGVTATAFRLTYCASPENRANAKVIFRSRIDEKPQTLPRNSWDLTTDGCAVRLQGDLKAGLYEAVYQAKGSPVAGLGLAAMRDFASYLKHGPNPSQRVIGYGYSQSGRFLREFVRDGFNADEQGRIAFDGLFVASAGAGGGSFNHRFAMPGQAGNSVLSILRPVDLPPFTDDGLLSKARSARVVPKIFYTFSSTEYWARAGSLTHTSEDGLKDVALASTSRLYFLAGTPHSGGAFPPSTGQQFKQYMNFAQQRWVQRALLLDLDAWVRGEADPPPSRHPSIAAAELVPLDAVDFPRAPSMLFTSYMPSVWRMDYGLTYNSKRVISNEPPSLGAPYRVLVPQVNADGNDRSGIRLLEIAVPLGTYTGWNIALPQLRDLQYLAGLVGSFDPFPLTREDRVRTNDSRRSIAERYTGREDYIRQVRRAADDLVRQRFMLANDVPAAVQHAEEMWNVIVGNRYR
jgi:Alpha/beta hydrolase domain